MASIQKSVCVYCGSHGGIGTSYATAAQDTGAMLMRNHWRLVYGVGDVGLMGRQRQQDAAPHAVSSPYICRRAR